MTPSIPDECLNCGTGDIDHAPCCDRWTDAASDPHCDASETGRHVLRTYA